MALATASIRRILAVAKIAGFSADNIAFGQGGALLQAIDRDTMKFAMKCSAIGVGGRQVEFFGRKISVDTEWRDVFKDPITDPGKASKKGLVTLYKSGNDYTSGIISEQPKTWADSKWTNALREVFRNGELLVDMTFDEVRANARQ